jgi:formiminoglutamase
VLVGFPQDEGVRRNGGRVGAAAAPDEIRKHLDRLTIADASAGVSLATSRPLDAGNIRLVGSLEDTQKALGRVVCGILQSGAIPVVLGGGHETAYGHYLGYVDAGIEVAILNIDAHLDVRPCLGGLGHSGSPFRQALEHPAKPLPGSRYMCVAAQPFAVSWEHARFVTEGGGKIYWADSAPEALVSQVNEVLEAAGCRLLLTVDADAFAAADVPGVSAPNPAGLPGREVMAVARLAGLTPEVASIEVVEVNPTFDVDGRSVRWAAIVVWQFLMGLAGRGKPG